jgi:hypothetical protein
MGKEVIADPSDTVEPLTAELLYATDPVIYREAGTIHNALRSRIRAVGISAVARGATLSRSTVKAFVNRGTVPHAASIAKIDCALRRLGP